MSNITQDPVSGGTAPHAANHANGGTDPVTPASIGAAASGHSHALTDAAITGSLPNTKLDAVPVSKLSATGVKDATTFLRGDNTFAVPPSGGGVQATLLDFKGDLIVASAADTAARLGVGADGQVLTADAAQALGVRWAVPGTNATAIRGVPVGTTAPVTGQILKHNGAEYAPSALGAIPDTDGVARVRAITQAAYDALATKDASTLYVISG